MPLDRGFQRFYKAVGANWRCVKDDWVTISEIATAMGYPTYYNNTKEIWDELRSTLPNLQRGNPRKNGRHGLYPMAMCTDGRALKIKVRNIRKRPNLRPSERQSWEFFACDWEPPMEDL